MELSTHYTRTGDVYKRQGFRKELDGFCQFVLGDVKLS